MFQRLEQVPLGETNMSTRADHSGSYLVDCNVNMEAAEPYAVNKDNAARLWALSEHIVSQKFEY